jgi:hypothetical protein
VTAPPVRELYLATADRAAALLAEPVVGERWHNDSVLADFDVGGLAGHLAGSILQVEMFLDAVAPTAEPITASTYYARLTGVLDPDSALNVGVRARGHEVAAAGHDALVEVTGDTLGRLHDRLPREPSDRRVEAFGRALLLDDYLHTRMVELSVHIEDLALSIGLSAPSLPDEARADAIRTLVSAAQERYGDVAVLHALTRRERDDLDALHVL